MKLWLIFFSYLLISGTGFYTLHQFGIDYSDINITVYAIPMMLLLTLLTYWANKENKAQPIHRLKYDLLRYIPHLSLILISSVLIEAVITDSFSPYLISALILCALIGYCEEGIFRRFMIPKFEQYNIPPFAAVMLSALCFGSIHMVNIFGGVSMEAAFSQSVDAFIFGLVTGLIFQQTRYFWPLVFLHMTIDYILFSGMVHLFIIQIVPSLLMDGIIIVTLLQVIWMKLRERIMI